MNQEMIIPLAYFITYTCYGTWLHGERANTVDRFHNTPGTDFMPPSQKKVLLVKGHMSEAPYFLDKLRQDIVLSSIQSVCNYNKWTLLAAHIRSNHVHVVVHGIAKPEKILNAFKTHSSRILNEAKIDQLGKKRWTRHGSTRYLWKEEEVEATIRYVVHEQGAPMAVYKNEKRAFAALF